MPHFDIIVLGLGGMGSSICAHLSQRGNRVLGLEQFDLNHSRGSSFGETRMIRMSYFEGSRYIPFLKRAYVLWDELSQKTGRSLFVRNGLLMFYSKGKDSKSEKIQSIAKKENIVVNEFLEQDLAQRFPQFKSPRNYKILFEPNAGYLKVEEAVDAHLKWAKENKAELRSHCPVLKWKAFKDEVEVQTATAKFRAKKLVVAGGAWLPHIIPQLKKSLVVRRSPQFWFPFENPIWKRSPCFAYDLPENFIYGFSSVDGKNIKIAKYNPDEIVKDPSRLDRTTTHEQLLPIQEYIKKYLPGVAIEPVKSTMCMMTLSPDDDFIIDTHPEFPNVILAGAGSGHAFKFTTVIGEIVSDLIAGSKTPYDLSVLSLSRAALRMSTRAFKSDSTVE